jgi:hypothetical protein
MGISYDYNLCFRGQTGLPQTGSSVPIFLGENALNIVLPVDEDFLKAFHGFDYGI